MLNPSAAAEYQTRRALVMKKVPVAPTSLLRFVTPLTRL